MLRGSWGVRLVEALIRIDTGEVICGRLPKAAGGLVEEWRRLHVGDLKANWERVG